MAAHKSIDRICCAVLALTLALCALFINGEALGLTAAGASLGYEERLFNASRVHTIDIVLDGWEDFLDGCEAEEYALCTLVIDGETYRNVGLRAKGNTSLTAVKAYGNDRYSFKVEFDHYESGKTYHGLDKLSLNNLIQDNTCLKDFLCYQLMGYFGVAAPLCSYVYITVNGQDWGLYLAVEGVEEGFLQRNYGSAGGNLYKPDSMDFGGGRGNGLDFQPEDWESLLDSTGAAEFMDRGTAAPPEGRPAGGHPAGEDAAPPGSGGRLGGMGADDVKLQYIDDNPTSYPNLLGSAKTNPTEADEARLIAALKALGEGDAAQVVDVEQVIRYFVVHGFVCNGDSYTGSMVHNYYLYEEGGVLSMIPWDYNLAFGGFDSGASAGEVVNAPIDSPVSGGSLEDRPMIAWIFASERYTALYHQYYREFLSAVFDSGYFTQLLNRVTALIAPYVERDPTKFCTYAEFQAGAAALETFCQLRAQSVSGQLAGTIPSTSQGQQAADAVLVDASGLRLADMGSLNTGGMAMTVQGKIPQLPQEDWTGQAPPEGASQAPGEFPQDWENMPQAPGDGQRSEGGFSPQGWDASTPQIQSGADWGLLAASGAVLLAGLVLALAFKRRP